MSTSISQHFSPWSLLKFTFPSIIMMILACFLRNMWQIDGNME